MTSEGGVLVGVSMHEVPTTVPNPLHTAAGIYGQIWLTNTETPTEWPLIILAQGAFGCDQSLGWTGHLALDPAACILFKFTSRSNCAASAAIMVEK